MHTHINACIYQFVHKHIYAHIKAYMYITRYKCIHTSRHMFVLIFMHTYMNINLFTYINAHKQIQTKSQIITRTHENHLTSLSPIFSTVRYFEADTFCPSTRQRSIAEIPGTTCMSMVCCCILINIKIYLYDM